LPSKCSFHDFNAIALTCQRSKIGKILPDALYVHLSALPNLDLLPQDYEAQARQLAQSTNQATEGATLVKFSTEKPKISYLVYPEFDVDPYPALQASIQVDLETQAVHYRDYCNSGNPFVLHRKEKFVTSAYPHYQKFAALTCQEEALGLLDNPRTIGTRQGWEQRLAQFRVVFQGHTLAHCSATDPRTAVIKIDRHKAAIARNDFSKPVRLALKSGLFPPETTFFD
jgi:DNA phosphorothioation-associated putative methyltransferase